MSLIRLRLSNVNFASDRIRIVRWVSESARPFEIVNDPGFQCLMKMERPDCYIPDAGTVARDVRNTFMHTRQQLAAKLQVC